MRLLGAGTATADDVAEWIGTTRACIDPRYLGAVPKTLARVGIIHRVGYERSCRPIRHASIISTWEIADRDAALAWLDSHPDLPEPEPDDAVAPDPCTPTSPSPAPVVTYSQMSLPY
jgi:hypothetical protein